MSKKIYQILGLFSILLWTCVAMAQESKPRIKLGAYYFAGWAGKSIYDNGTPENEWAKGMPSHFSRKLGTEFAGRTPLWGWRDDKPELMEHQIDIAADNGISYFSFCWYWADNKGPINVQAIEKDTKHLPMQMFMKAKNNQKMEFCLLIANHSGFEINGLDAWKQASDYWITLFKHPRYLRLEGKPILVIFSPRGASQEGLAYLQSAAKKAGFPGVALVGCGSGKVEDGFSIRTNYNVKPAGTKISEKHSYQELIDANVKEWHNTPDQQCIPVLTAGWDRRPWEAKDGQGFGNGVPITWYFERGTNSEFSGYMEKIAHWMESHPEQITKDRLALVYAWNEIGEGGWLVPCRDDPDGAYLKSIRKVVFGK